MDAGILPVLSPGCIGHLLLFPNILAYLVFILSVPSFYVSVTVCAAPEAKTLAVLQDHDAQ